MGEVYINKQPTASNFSYVYSENSNGEIVRISKDTLVQLIAEQVGVGGDISGTVDANNTITVTHSLPNGNYTLVYENSDGSTTTIGTLVVEGSTSSGEGDVSGNLVRTSKSADGSIFNGTGYKDGYRLNSSGAEVSLDGKAVTGFMEFSIGEKIYAENVGWGGSNDKTKNYIAFYNSSHQKIQSVSESDILAQGYTANNLYYGNSGFKLTIPESLGLSLAGTKYIRISGTGNGINYIVKKNEEI